MKILLACFLAVICPGFLSVLTSVIFRDTAGNLNAGVSHVIWMIVSNFALLTS
jgi:hypothetical protein